MTKLLRVPSETGNDLINDRINNHLNYVYSPYNGPCKNVEIMFTVPTKVPVKKLNLCLQSLQRSL